MNHPNSKIMQEVIKEAEKSADKGQYALAAAVVMNDRIISVANTNLHETQDPSAHAEMNAIRNACSKTGSRYLEGAWLYTTQEPCPMCTSVAIWAKMSGIVFGAYENDAIEMYKKQAGSQFTWRQINITASYVASKGEPKLKVIEGFMRDECVKLYELNSK